VTSADLSETAAGREEHEAHEAEIIGPDQSATTELSATDSAVVGCVDSVSENGVFGWAWYPDTPGKIVELDIVCDGTIVATVTADRYRSDLESAGIGDGACAFEFRFGGSNLFRPGAYGVRVSRTAVPLLSIPDTAGVSQISELVGRLVAVERFAARSAPLQPKLMSAIKSLASRLEALEARLREVGEGQDATDVHGMRMDAAIVKIEAKLAALSPKKRTRIAPPLVLTAIVSAVIAMVVTYVTIMLMVGPETAPW